MRKNFLPVGKALVREIQRRIDSALAVHFLYEGER